MYKTVVWKMCHTAAIYSELCFVLWTDVSPVRLTTWKHTAADSASPRLISRGQNVAHYFTWALLYVFIWFNVDDVC